MDFFSRVFLHPLYGGSKRTNDGISSFNANVLPEILLELTRIYGMSGKTS